MVHSGGSPEGDSLGPGQQVCPTSELTGNTSYVKLFVASSQVSYTSKTSESLVTTKMF